MVLGGQTQALCGRGALSDFIALSETIHELDDITVILTHQVKVCAQESISGWMIDARSHLSISNFFFLKKFL